MRLVYVVSLFPCWSETFIVREIEQLQKLGAEVSIVSLKPHSEPLVQADAAALLPRVTYPVSGVAALRQLLQRPLQSARELWRIAAGMAHAPDAWARTLVVWWRTLGLLARVRAMRPQHLHAHWATYPSTAALVLSERLGVPFSFTAHAHDIFVNDHLLARKLRAARFAVTISQFNRRLLAERFGTEATRRVDVIHCGVPRTPFADTPRERDPTLVLAVGRLDAIKGFHHLIDACAVLRRRRVPLQCLIIGDGPLRHELQSRIAMREVSDCVTLAGAQGQQQVQAAMCRAAVFVLPSVVTPGGDRDGIPVALMEAMAAGVPVVSTAVSGIPELVTHGQSGLLVDATDSELLADSIERLLRDRPLAAALTASARRTIAADFDLEVLAHRLHDRFRASIAGAR